MNLSKYQFKPKLWASILTLIFMAVFVSLGNWQLSRADEKTHQHEQLGIFAKESAITLPESTIQLQQFQYREIEVMGEYLNNYTILIDNRTYHGRAGYHVITPFRIKNSHLHVAVNRGWISIGNDRSVLPTVLAMEGEQKLLGTVASPEIRTLEISKKVVEGVVWENFSLQRLQDRTQLAFQPILVLQKKAEDDGLIRDWVKPESGAIKNIGYAIQWFSLALLTVIIYIVLNVKRRN